MKFICLGYADLAAIEKMPPERLATMMEECLTYDDELRRNGHFTGGEALQGPNTAATLWWRDGKVNVVDGPYAETKEHLGGILILEANDLTHAIELMSKHPGVRFGPFEIRPASPIVDELYAARKAAGK